jgi:hypothetical protein
MKIKLSLYFLLLTFGLMAQGLIHKSLYQGNSNQAPLAECGQQHYNGYLNKKLPGFSKLQNEKLQTLVAQTEVSQKTTGPVYTIPVVFHILYNDSTENLPDSVIQNQVHVLNESFRRQNADTINLRPEFDSLVGDARIEFKLATTDPNGNPTNGITRTPTNITHFGGVLPYGQGQISQIQQWIADSLFYNFFRLTNTALGGIDAWDTARYFNIWVGDLRILEPQINNFEELFLLGLATPPGQHPNFAGTGFDTLVTEQGALLHYTAIGPGNPNAFPAPYGLFNSTLNEGGITVHEAGHYLGLRHIWGDGNCGADDFIDDTPRSAASGQFTCNKVKNTCLDTINGVNLKDMVENFMDYSSDACWNSFTNGQIDLMRATLETFRSSLYTVSSPEYAYTPTFSFYPNPTANAVTITSATSHKALKIEVSNIQGQRLYQTEVNKASKAIVPIRGPEGLYVIKVTSGQNTQLLKVLKRN